MQYLVRYLGYFLFFIPSVLLWGKGISYSVNFEGLEDGKTLKALKSISQLIVLKKKLPTSLNALRFRAESDTVDLIKMLKANGYLEAEIQIKIEEGFENYIVIVNIHPGPQYLLEKFEIQFTKEILEKNPQLPSLESLKNLGIHLSAQTKQILDTELCAMHVLSECGYPLAKIKDREIIANGETKTIQVTLEIDPGFLAHFGPTIIEGNIQVHPPLIEQKIQWQQKQLYNSNLVEGTQKALMDTGLFSSVYITHEKNLDHQAELPMKIEVCETKHKNVSMGASYQTTFGPGITFGWENHNVGGMGRKIIFQADIAERSHSGVASFSIPNFHSIGQNLVFQAQASHESISAFHDQSYSVLARLEREIFSSHLSFSLGPKLEYTILSSSVNNGNFLLIEGLFFLRWSNVKDFLNPTSGIRIDYKMHPALTIKDKLQGYFGHTLTFCSYFPFETGDVFTLAQKFTLGTIFCNELDAIPVSKRFFGGADDNLRGYKYWTVSPLNKKDKPLGGRSAVYYTLEPRFRVTKSFGLVPFFDMGKVYLEQFPTFQGKWRKSVGMGVRYFSFIGPLRLDVAFPLNRREGIDPKWWMFVSLGQTF